MPRRDSDGRRDSSKAASNDLLMSPIFLIPLLVFRSHATGFSQSGIRADDLISEGAAGQ
jgi:hypothetical protein